MKEVLIISGKGGTGKTILTGAFSSIVENKIIIDCDVDAADLHLLLSPLLIEEHVYKSGKTARINLHKCAECRKCSTICRFGAISQKLQVDPILCEGCGFCSHICPVGAIEMIENETGQWFVSDTKYGPFIHARLGIAEENSGKLVSLVRSKGKELAAKKEADWVIIDGPPGIGCPVIASLSGVSAAVIVTEPTLSGLHDAQRVMEVAIHFNVPVRVVINKHDLNPAMTTQIKEFCNEKNVPVIGEIPFDKQIIESMVNGKTIIEHLNGKYEMLIQEIWNKII